MTWNLATYHFRLWRMLLPPDPLTRTNLRRFVGLPGLAFPSLLQDVFGGRKMKNRSHTQPHLEAACGAERRQKREIVPK